jgi:hypothetical protein
MKNFTIFLTALAITLTSANVYGQLSSRLNLGVKGGLNLANITGETDNKLKTAFHAGVYSEVNFDYFIMAQVDFLVSYQGHAPIDDTPFASALNLWYINVPIVARYNFSYNFNVHVGIQPGFLLSAKVKVNEDGVEPFDVKDQTKGFDFGLPIGVGYDFLDKKMGVTLRYIIPIANISDVTGQTRRNSVFQLSIGYKLFSVDA